MGNITPITKYMIFTARDPLSSESKINDKAYINNGFAKIININSK